MKSYLSFGGGVNSTAMLLLLLDEGWEFEALYVDHGCDWPETRKFVYWLSKYTPITILRAKVIRKGKQFDSLYDFCWHYEMVPSLVARHCTRIWKIDQITKYIKPPAFQLIGFSTDEGHRAKIKNSNGLESRYPLLEYEISRHGCIEIIKDHGIPVPMKSGCYFCPMQRISQWRLLRQKHPELFCKVKQLEERNIAYRKRKGKKPLYLYANAKSLDEVVNENQEELFLEFKPPCNCML